MGRLEGVLELPNAFIGHSDDAQENASRRIAEAAGVVLAHHQRDQPAELVIDVNQWGVLELGFHVHERRASEEVTIGGRNHPHVLLQPLLELGVLLRRDQRFFPLDVL